MCCSDYCRVLTSISRLPINIRKDSRDKGNMAEIIASSAEDDPSLPKTVDRLKDSCPTKFNHSLWGTKALISEAVVSHVLGILPLQFALILTAGLLDEHYFILLSYS